MVRKTSEVVKRVIVLVVLGITFVVIGMPLYWIVATSFKAPLEWNTQPPIWFPSSAYLENYAIMWKKGGDMALLNTTIISLCSSLLCMFVGSMMAYAISRYKTGGNSLLFFVVSIRMIPPAVLIVPIILMYTWYALIDTYAGLVLIYALMNLPYTVYLMKTFFDGVPHEIEEAAMVDGAPAWRTFLSIGLPLAAPGLIVTFLFALVASWNEFFYAVTLTRIQAFTVPVKIAAWFNQNTGYDWGPQSAQALVAIIPVLIIALIVQKWMVKGLTLGAVKG